MTYPPQSLPDDLSAAGDGRRRGRWAVPAVHLVLFILLVAVITIVPPAYLRHERFFYSWDIAAYHEMATRKVEQIQSAPRWAVGEVYRSLGKPHNELFTLAVVPFLLGLGNSRTAFVLSMALVFLLPYSLATGALARELVEERKAAAFWVAAFFTVATPVAWSPLLQGWPDAGAACLFSLAVWAYVRDVQLRRPWQIPLISVLGAGSILFRRHFAYAVVAFLAAATVQAVLELGANLQSGRAATRELWRRIGRIALTGIGGLFTACAIGWPFVRELIFGESVIQMHVIPWRVPTWPMLVFLGGAYGWFGYLLALAGLAAGTRLGFVRRPVLRFLGLFALIWIILWSFHIRISSAHYLYPFTSVMVLGLTALVWSIARRYRGIYRTVGLALVLVYASVNAVWSLAPIDPPGAPPATACGPTPSSMPLLAMREPPLRRSDYDELVRLVEYLRTQAPGAPLYVIGSSEFFNADLLRLAEQALHEGQRRVLRILPSAEVDVRDRLLLRNLLRAEYVLSTSPLQYHLDPAQQDVVTVAAEEFHAGELATAFRAGDQAFTLCDGATIRLYRRVTPLPPDRAARVLLGILARLDSRDGARSAADSATPFPVSPATGPLRFHPTNPR